MDTPKIEQLESGIEALKEADLLAELSLDNLETRINKEKQNLETAKQEKEQIEKGKDPKSQSWMDKSSRLGLMAAGAFGLFRMGQWGLTKIIPVAKLLPGMPKKFPMLSGAISAAAMGKLIGDDNISQWTQDELGWEVNSHSFSDFAGRASSEGFFSALDAFKIKTSSKEVKRLARKLEISPNTIANLESISYGQFTSVSERAKRQGWSYTRQVSEMILLPDINIPGTEIDDMARQGQAEWKLQNYLKRNVDKLNVEEEVLKEMTLLEIIEELDHMK